MLSHQASSWLLPFFLFTLPNVLGRELVPIRPSRSLSKRADNSALDLKNQETFLWGNSDDSSAQLANLTVYTPGDDENIISMEQFDGMLTSVQCNDDNIEMTFEDDAAFAYAQKTWDWVNGAENSSFVMIAGVGICGDNTGRIPFVVSSIACDEEANKATLTASQSDWTSIAHTYDLVAGGFSDIPAAGAVQARDIDKTASIDFVHDFPFSFALGVPPLEARIACTNCSSTGSFEMEFKVSQKLFIPTGASMKIKPKGVSAIAQIKLSGSGDVTDSLVKEFDIIEIPISGIKIPGILELGPFLTVSVGAELSAISISAGVQSGATAKLSDDAILEVDLLNPDKNTFSGWEPEIDTIDVRVDGSITGGVAVFLKPAVELKAEALGQGFEIGLNMKVPNINAKLSAIASPQGACAAPEKKTAVGVNIGVNIGAALNIAATKSGDSDPLFTVQIAALDKPLATKCFPIGDELAARSLGGSISSRQMRSVAAA